MEEWKQIEGFPNYMISNKGRIKSLKRRGTDERILKHGQDRKGYLIIGLYNNNKPYGYRIHRLVAYHFISPPKDGQQINHKNGIKTDNRVENLEWCTPSENNKHALNNGLRTNKGEKHSRHKLTEKQIVEIRRRYKEENITQKQLGKEYGIAASTTSQIINSKRWSHVKV